MTHLMTLLGVTPLATLVELLLLLLGFPALLWAAIGIEAWLGK